MAVKYRVDVYLVDSRPCKLDIKRVHRNIEIFFSKTLPSDDVGICPLNSRFVEPFIYALVQFSSPEFISPQRRQIARAPPPSGIYQAHPALYSLHKASNILQVLWGRSTNTGSGIPFFF